MMCLASCQVLERSGQNNQGTIKHHQGRALHPILYAIRFLKAPAAVSPNSRPRLAAYSAVMQPASWRVRSGSETNFKAPPSWNSRQPTKNCCFGGPVVWEFRRGNPPKNDWEPGIPGNQRYPESRIPKPAIYHELTMEEPPAVPKKSSCELFHKPPFPRNQKNDHLAAAKGRVEKKNMSLT